MSDETPEFPVEETPADSGDALPADSEERSDNEHIFVAVGKAQKALTQFTTAHLLAAHSDEVAVIIDAGGKLLSDLEGTLPLE